MFQPPEDVDGWPPTQRAAARQQRNFRLFDDDLDEPQLRYSAPATPRLGAANPRQEIAELKDLLVHKQNEIDRMKRTTPWHLAIPDTTTSTPAVPMSNELIQRPAPYPSVVQPTEPTLHRHLTPPETSDYSAARELIAVEVDGGDWVRALNEQRESILQDAVGDVAQAVESQSPLITVVTASADMKGLYLTILVPIVPNLAQKLETMTLQRLSSISNLHHIRAKILPTEIAPAQQRHDKDNADTTTVKQELQIERQKNDTLLLVLETLQRQLLSLRTKEITPLTTSDSVNELQQLRKEMDALREKSSRLEGDVHQSRVAAHTP